MDPDVRRVRLRLQGDQLSFADSAPGGEAQRDLGSLAATRAGLERGPLTAAGLERAIAQVEDLIMPVIGPMPRGMPLQLIGPEWTQLFDLLPDARGGAVPIESVESLFNQLADYAAGSPVAWRQASPPSRVALGLVVLREVIHHGGFRSVSILPLTQ